MAFATRNAFIIDQTSLVSQLLVLPFTIRPLRFDVSPAPRNCKYINIFGLTSPPAEEGASGTKAYTWIG